MGLMRVMCAVAAIVASVSLYAADAATPASQSSVSAAEYLRGLPPPAFMPGHTLPRLTRFGWKLPVPARAELAAHWGYALEFGGYVTNASIANLDKPNSDEAQVAALAKSDPATYPLAVICSREMPRNSPPETWTRDAEGHFLDGKARSLDGNVWDPSMKTVYSPEAPDSVWQAAGELRAKPLGELVQRGLPIAIVLNGGEYGLGVLGFAGKVWQQDPRVVKAKGDRSWPDYIAQRKGHAEKIIADAVRKAVPDRKLYVYYTAGGNTQRNKNADSINWLHSYEGMRGVGDLPSSEIYYKSFNDGLVGKVDLLTLVLNAVSRQIAMGDPLSYDWVCGGWERGDPKNMVADMDRWTGFLKCCYTTGMIGCNVGYYEMPPGKGGFAATFPADQPPVWLRQLVVSGYVHALFSHLEGYLREGDLLPGPSRHRFSSEDRAYEFPTGDDNARVLVRKLRKKPEWLLTAWVADGPDREVSVTVPEVGEVRAFARGVGSIYRVTLANNSPRLEQLDVR